MTFLTRNRIQSERINTEDLNCYSGYLAIHTHTATFTGFLVASIAATNGIVLATEKKLKSILYDEHSIPKIEMITKHSGLVYSGMGPDYR